MKIKYKNTRTAFAAGKVNHDDYFLLLKKGVNISALINDAIKSAADQIRANTETNNQKQNTKE